MFHIFKAPYNTCNLFTNFTPNEYIRPYIISHVVPTFFASASPECVPCIEKDWENYEQEAHVTRWRAMKLQPKVATEEVETIEDEVLIRFLLYFWYSAVYNMYC